MTATFAPGIVDPAASVLRQHGRRAAAASSAASAATRRDRTPAISTTRSSSPARTLLHPGARAGRAVRDRRRPRRAGRRRSRSDRDRDLAARPAAAHRPQGHDARRGRAPRPPPTTSAWPPIQDLTKATKIAIQEMVDFLVADEEAGQALGLSADQHRRQRRDHAAGRRRRSACTCKMPKSIFTNAK